MQQPMPALLIGSLLSVVLAGSSHAEDSYNSGNPFNGLFVPSQPGNQPAPQPVPQPTPFAMPPQPAFFAQPQPIQPIGFDPMTMMMQMMMMPQPPAAK